MEFNFTLETDLKTEEVTKKVLEAAKKATKAVVIDNAQDAIEQSPALTGNNKRSIKYEVGPGGEIAKKDLEGAVYSTSGYGGYLETGTVKMAARPYFRPALDKFAKNLPNNIKGHLS